MENSRIAELINKRHSCNASEEELQELQKLLILDVHGEAYLEMLIQFCTEEPRCAPEEIELAYARLCSRMIKEGLFPEIDSGSGA